MKKIVTLLVLTSAVAGLTVAQAADVTGTITLKGTPPKEKEISPLVADATCGKLHTTPPTTHFYVVGGKGELADVIVSLEGPGLAGKSSGASAAPTVMDQKGCEYIPQIFAVQTGQKITVKNSDPVGHNVHSHPTAPGNDEKNMMQQEKAADLNFVFPKAEAFLKFNCDVHPWMFAWVSVFDHPYFAVSGKDGSFKIANVPPGKYTLKAAHRKAGVTTQEIEVKDGAAPVALTLEVK